MNGQYDGDGGKINYVTKFTYMTSLDMMKDSIVLVDTKELMSDSYLNIN